MIIFPEQGQFQLFNPDLLRYHFHALFRLYRYFFKPTISGMKPFTVPRHK